MGWIYLEMNGRVYEKKEWRDWYLDKEKNTIEPIYHKTAIVRKYPKRVVPSNPICKVRSGGHRPTLVHRDKSKYSRKAKYRTGELTEWLLK